MKKVKESNCCEKCGILKDENILLTTVKTWQGNISMCEECYSEYQEEKAEKSKLYAYICKKNGLNSITNVILGQVKKLKNMGYSYSQIMYLVYYTHNIAKTLTRNFHTVSIMFCFPLMKRQTGRN